MNDKSKQSNRDVSIKIISFGLAAVVIMAGFIVKGYATAAKYKLMLENSYSSAMTDLANYTQNISTTLQKELYCSTNMQIGEQGAQLATDAACAKACLEKLPVNAEYTSSIYKFLAQAGDYSIYLSKCSADEIGTDERNNLEKLYGYSKQLSAAISDIQAVACDSCDNGWWTSEIDKMLKSANSKAESSLSQLNQSIKDNSGKESDYPKLIYDGPYSDHMMQGSADFIKNKAEISLDAAKTIAAKYLDVSKEKIQYVSTDNGNIKSYIFNCGSKSVAITQKGGALLYMDDSSGVLARNIEPEKAVENAKKYLSNKLNMSFSESYYMIDSNVCVVNLAYNDGGVICYPDLIKVGVSLDDGSVVSIEAGGFVMNHEKRALDFENSKSKARAVVSSHLSVKSDAKCVINKGTDKEYLCYEFVCKGENDEDVLVYVDAATLVEQNILILQKSEAGTLAK